MPTAGPSTRRGGPFRRRPADPAPITPAHLAALAYLTIAVTVLVFMAWYGALERLGVDRTGLFNGLVPVTSVAAVALTGTGAITPLRLIGALAVLAGVILGLRRTGSVGGMAETTWLDATAQADLVRRGEVSPEELTEAAIARIEAVNPQLDAVMWTRFDRARPTPTTAAARSASRPASAGWSGSSRPAGG